MEPRWSSISCLPQAKARSESGPRWHSAGAELHYHKPRDTLMPLTGGPLIRLFLQEQSVHIGDFAWKVEAKMEYFTL